MINLKKEVNYTSHAAYSKILQDLQDLNQPV